MTSTDDIARRFAKNTAEHQMTVLHDDGLYRHLAFRNTEHGWLYWFDLITVPGALIFQGDGESFTFRRTTDMFEFFRGSAWQGRPNLHYWAEKVTSEQSALKRYDEDLFVRTMREHYVELIRDGDVPPGTSKALLAHAEDYDLSFEENARAMIDEFEHEGFHFSDTWEWDFRDYHWWFVWACQAIVWGIAQYDAYRNVSRWQRLKRAITRSRRKPVPCVPLAAPPQPAAPETVNGRPAVDVQLPEPVGSGA
jgi:hypothetical protein